MAKGQGYWWFDMFSGSYDDPVMMEAIADIHRVQQNLMEQSAESVAETVMLIDQESSYYVKGHSFYPMVEHMLPEINRTAIPYDVGMTFDINKDGFDKDKYKLYLLPVLFCPDGKMVETLDGLRRQGKNMLFFHAPYYALEEEPMRRTSSVWRRRRWRRAARCSASDRIRISGGNSPILLSALPRERVWATP